MSELYNEVARLKSTDGNKISGFLATLGLSLVVVEERSNIPGSFWGECEAGLVAEQLYARADTPLHSILHETCHWLCMDDKRRQQLHTDAGGDYDEENAVCYLQILLADHLPGYSSNHCLADMDAWGYSFRLGSAKAWFEHDAEDARDWLKERGILENLRFS